jgi:homocitrate synthase NifV
LTEIYKINPKVESESLNNLYLLLDKLGTDYFEIDSNIVKLLPNVNPNKTLFRISEYTDVNWIKNTQITKFVINHKCICKEIKNLLYIRETIINTKNIKEIVLEVNLQQITELYRFLKSEDAKFIRSTLRKWIKTIRLKGLDSCIPFDIKKQIAQLKEQFDLEVDICPENSFYCASAIAIDSAFCNIDYITCTFSGIGGENGFAALEEVIMGLKIIHKLHIKGDTALFQKVKEAFEKLVSKAIPKTKPILGDEIFSCESGIHVDGILKNPANYEPYPPEMVGLKRKLVLGKHSGKAGIINKLHELKIDSSMFDIDAILEGLRNKGSEHKGLSDNEILHKLLSEGAVRSV